MSETVKKRGRKKKEPTEEKPNLTLVVKETITTETSEAKKRGRKPKGGKLITKVEEKVEAPLPLVNIILHLKCSFNDLQEYNNRMNKMLTSENNYNPDVPPEVQSFNIIENDNKFTNYNNENLDNKVSYAYNDKIIRNEKIACYENPQKMNINSFFHNNENDEEDNITLKDINMKLKELKINLYKNNMQDKKSACFWCTYDYDNPSCYIPKYEIDDKLYGYGSFCRPECAVAYLMNESLDDSTKFERYQLLNQIYGKIYEYKKNIKPAPDPYFLLNKYYGNLSIQEYRKLLKTEHLLIVVDKPMTRVLPELFEDNDSLILNIYGNSNNVSNIVSGTSSRYKVRRQSEKTQEQSKNSIVRDRFGIK